MSSSGLASSTMKSALFPAATVPSLSSFGSPAELRVAAAIASAGVKPASTMLAISRWEPKPNRRPVGGSGIVAQSKLHPRRLERQHASRYDAGLPLRHRIFTDGRVFQHRDLGGGERLAQHGSSIHDGRRPKMSFRVLHSVSMTKTLGRSRKRPRTSSSTAAPLRQGGCARPSIPALGFPSRRTARTYA